MYTITLSNGTALSGLVLNGNNFIAPNEIADSVFDGNLGTVTISDGEKEDVYADMVLLSNIVRDGQSWIVLNRKSEEEKRQEARDREIAELRRAMAVLLTGKEA